ncbi:hypothetical protein HDU92_003609 [Lobulomyces angularis]|nr:hypothetical protein HDU92_003609 [Lobulomyces angularis]
MKNLVTVISIAAITVFLITTKKKKPTYNNIPVYKGGVFFFGHLFQFLKFGKKKKVHELIEDFNKSDPIISYYFFNVEGIMTSKAELIRGVLNSKNFVRDDFAIKAFEGISKFSLFVLPTSDLWKKHRKMIQPAFAPQHLERSFNVTSEVCDRLFALIEDGSNNVPMHDYLNYISCDVIGKVAFSYDFEFTNSIKNLKDPKFNVIRQFDSIATAVGMRIATPKVLWGLLGAYPDKGTHANISNTVRRIVQEKKSGVSENKSYAEAAVGKWEMDVLDRLLENSSETESDPHESEEAPFTDEELCDEIFGFFLAGHETTANSLSFMLLELTKYPLIAKRLTEEIDPVMNDGNFAFQKLGELKYLDCFIKESLRMHPVLPGIGKVASKDEFLGEYFIKKGTPVMANLMCVHFSEQYWDKPKVFLPERWENNFTPVPGSYAPFGDGPHNCIGQKLALIEMKVVLSKILHTFDFVPREGQNFDVVYNLTMRLKDGIYLNLKKRKHVK